MDGECLKAIKMKLKKTQIRIFNRIFEAETGYLLNFGNQSFSEFFDEELNIDIDDDIYKAEGDSKAKRTRYLIKTVDLDNALKILDKLWEHKSLINPQKAIDDLADYHSLIESLKKQGEHETSGSPPKSSVSGIDYSHLRSEMSRIAKMQPQPRGYAFEKWLGELFGTFNLAPRGSFRNVGEQIDGSFRLDSSYYLMEAKWHNQKTAASDLHAFQGKLKSKAEWTRGVFISWMGFTEDGLSAFGKGNKVICVSGEDIYHCLKNNIPFPVLLEAKIRHASETGECFIQYNAIKNLPQS